MSRIIFSITLTSILLLLCAVGFAQEFDEDGRQLIQAPYTYAPPEIDGILNPGEWDGAASNFVDFDTLGVAGNDGPGESDGVEDISYTFYVSYDDTYLYIGVSVTDDIYISENYGTDYRYDLPVTWENDAVEYFFDGDASRTLESCRNAVETEMGGQWIYGLGAEDTAVPFVSPELYGDYERPFGSDPGADWYAQTVVNDETADWTQEARFKLSIIGSPSAGSEIGFNIGVDDVEIFDEQTVTDPNYYAGHRDIQLFWFAYFYEPGEISEESVHEIEDLWGTLRFLEPVSVSNWFLF